MPRITQREIAKALNTSKCAVSLALRDLPGVSSQLRKKIKDYAAQRGYQPNAVLSHLAKNRWRVPTAKPGMRLGLIAQHNPLRSEYVAHSAANEVMAVVKDQCAHFGYGIEFAEINTEETPAKAVRILIQRGVEGFIILNIFTQRFIDLFPWRKKPAVGVGSGFFTFPVDSFHCDGTRAVKRCWRQLIKRGYQRILYIEGEDPPEHPVWMNIRACLRELNLMDERLVLVDCCRLSDGLERIKAKIASGRLDAIFGFNASIFYALCSAGIRIPEEIAFISVFSLEKDITTSGMVADNEEMTFRAIAALDQLIRRGAPLPPTPTRTLLNTPWHEGETLPDRTLIG